MQNFVLARRSALCALAVLATFPGLGAASEAKQEAGKIAITTASQEARQLYLKGRDLSEKLRATDARKSFEAAVAKDPAFALAYVGLANTSGTAKEFFDAVERARGAAPKASESERLLIEGLDAGAKGEVARQKQALTKLTAKNPNDERGHNLLGVFQFGQQDYAASVDSFKKAIAINPSFSQPYNQMGYAYRFMGKYADAEQAFKNYIELIPNDPNPYDSYAELLMKQGRYAESIENYEKALKADSNFVASYVGIGNDQMFMGKGDEARKTFARLAGVARNDGEKRQAMFWTATSYLHERATDKAIAEVKKMAAVAEASKDLANLSGDYNLTGDILLEAGRHQEAEAQYKLQVESMGKANVPAEVKEATRRNSLFDRGRVAIAKNDVAAAKAISADYARQVAAKGVPFEIWQSHELAGRVALAEKDHATAVKELQQANQQDPRVLYLLAVAFQGKGDGAKAKETAAKAADWNALAGNYAYVRAKAKQLASKS